MISAPVLVCGHCGAERTLRCFVYRADDHRFIAECVDLDILSEGESEEEAIGGLQEAMHGYLSVVFDGSSKEGLLLRKSPVSRRLRYYWYRLKDAVATRLNPERRAKESHAFCFHDFKEGRLSHCTK